MPVLLSKGLVPFERYFLLFQLDVQAYAFVLQKKISSQNKLRVGSRTRCVLFETSHEIDLNVKSINLKVAKRIKILLVHATELE